MEIFSNIRIKIVDQSESVLETKNIKLEIITL